MMKLMFYPLREADLDEIVMAFKTIGWHKPKSIYEAYLVEQSKKTRSIFVAKIRNKFCGYVTLKWRSAYPPFNENNIPEIVDLNVLPSYRKQGIASQLIEECERLAKNRGHNTIGLGVGLSEDYGNAQRLYIRLGFMPNGKGIYYQNKLVNYGDKVTVDDDLLLYLTKSLSAVTP